MGAKGTNESCTLDQKIEDKCGQGVQKNTLTTLITYIMCSKFVFFTAFIALVSLPFGVKGQKSATRKSPVKTAVDSMMMESNVFVFKQTSSSPDTTKATLRVRVLGKGGKAYPIQGATVLLHRNKDKMLGRVTKHDGRCLFELTPASYSILVQMTGLKTLEKSGFALEVGKVYDLEIMMAQN